MLPLGSNQRRREAPRSSALSSPEKKVTSTRFGGSWKWWLTGGFHDELAGGGWRAVHGEAVGEFWWAATLWHARLSSPEWARDGELTAAAFLAREWEEGESGRVHCVRGVAVEVMRALGANEQRQERCTGPKCRRSSVAGRPRRRARLRLRHGVDRLTQQLQQWLSSKPKRVRRWRSWQIWSTSWVLQHCKLEQGPDRPGLRDMKLPKSIEQTARART